MKLCLVGHDERYVVEQGMLSLFPGEHPVYGEITPEDERAAAVTVEESADTCRVRTEIRRDGAQGVHELTAPLTGTPFERVGARRRAVGRCFFFAAREIMGTTPAWGMLTGVRPVKLPTRAMRAGKSEEEAARMLAEDYCVSPRRAALAAACAKASIAAQDALAPDELSLYIGIPFCPTRCAYCSFVSADVGRSLSLLPPFLEALEKELSATGKLLREAGKHVRTIYVGGGTPTTLSAGQLDALLCAVERELDLSRLTELTVEAGRPDTITAEKLAVLRSHGVERVSVNPQTMSDEVLCAMGRAHTAQDIREAMALVEKSGIEAVNMDLIAGLPKDTPEGFARTLEEVIGFAPANITVHTLALKKGSRLMTEGGDLPGAQDVAAMLDHAEEALRGAGYVPYYLYRQKYMSGSFENVGWCLPGTENLYNIVMMEELQTVLALGGGAVSKRIEPGKIVRQANPKYPQEYIASIDRVIADKRALLLPDA